MSICPKFLPKFSGLNTVSSKYTGAVTINRESQTLRHPAPKLLELRYGMEWQAWVGNYRCRDDPLLYGPLIVNLQYLCHFNYCLAISILTTKTVYNYTSDFSDDISSMHGVPFLLACHTCNLMLWRISNNILF